MPSANRQMKILHQYIFGIVAACALGSCSRAVTEFEFCKIAGGKIASDRLIVDPTRGIASFYSDAPVHYEVHETAEARGILDPLPLVLPTSPKPTASGQPRDWQIGSYRFSLYATNDPDIALIESRPAPETESVRSVQSSVLFSYRDGVLAIRQRLAEDGKLVMSNTLYPCGGKPLFASDF
jgi:hypothetical protein